MSRSIRKGPFVQRRLLERVVRQKNENSREPLRTWARSCTIVPEFVGHTFLVHNGKSFLRTFVTENMVGHKLGEFSPTRTVRGHGGRKK